MKERNYEGENPPTLSIANGFFIMILPDSLKNATITELKLTSLASFSGRTVLARAGRHKFIKSHVLLFSSQPENLREVVDNIMDKGNRLLMIFLTR